LKKEKAMALKAGHVSDNAAVALSSAQFFKGQCRNKKLFFLLLLVLQSLVNFNFLGLFFLCF
jgi:hypothetical protein